MSTFSKRYIVGLHDDTTVNTTTYFNGDPYHSPGIALAYTMDAILKAYKSDTSYGITTENYPFKRDLDGNSNRAAGTAGSGFSIAFVILFGVAFLTTSFILFLIKERMSGAKHLQKVGPFTKSQQYEFYFYLYTNIVHCFKIVVVLITKVNLC